MAIAYVEAVNDVDGGGSATSLSIAKADFNSGSGPNEGDTLLIIGVTDGTQNGARADISQTHWTRLSDARINPLAVYFGYRIATASEPTNYSFTITAGGSDIVTTVLRFTGCDGTNPVHSWSLARGEIGATTIKIDELFAYRSPTLLVSLAAGNSSFTTTTNPSGYSNRTNYSGASTALHTFFATKAQATTAPNGTGTGLVCDLSSSDQGICLHVALQETSGDI